MEKETIAMEKEKLKREETIRLEQLEWGEKCKKVNRNGRTSCLRKKYYFKKRKRKKKKKKKKDNIN